jgi:hypothetical protein
LDYFGRYLKKEWKMNDQALKDYFEFDDIDLNANRSGRLSEKQVKKLVKNEKNYKRDGIIYGLILLAIASIFPFAFIPQSIAAWQKHNIGGALVPLIPVVIWVVIWGGIGLFLMVDGFKDRSKIRLKRVEGPINLVAVEVTGTHGHHSINHELHIGDFEYEVDEDLASIMMQGDIYAVYFTVDADDDDSARTVLSAELVQPSGASKSSPAAAPLQPVAVPHTPSGADHYCINCGAPNPSGAKFCNTCGKPLPA